MFYFLFYFCSRSVTPDSDGKLPLFGRALRSEIKLEPLDLLGGKYKVTSSSKCFHRMKHCEIKLWTRCSRWRVAGQQHAGWLALGQRLPRGGEARYRGHDGPGGDLWHPVSQQRAPGDTLQIRHQEIYTGQSMTMEAYCCHPKKRLSVPFLLKRFKFKFERIKFNVWKFYLSFFFFFGGGSNELPYSHVVPDSGKMGNRSHDHIWIRCLSVCYR